MSAGNYSIRVEQGATFVRTITVEDGGSPRDLTGYTARLKVRATREADEVFLAMDTAGGAFTIPSPAAGQIILTLTATETAALTAVSGYRYDLEIEDAAGVVTRLLEGTFTVDREVTRP